jgi:hypothetical protein
VRGTFPVAIPCALLTDDATPAAGVGYAGSLMPRFALLLAAALGLAGASLMALGCSKDTAVALWPPGVKVGDIIEYEFSLQTRCRASQGDAGGEASKIESESGSVEILAMDGDTPTRTRTRRVTHFRRNFDGTTSSLLVGREIDDERTGKYAWTHRLVGSAPQNTEEREIVEDDSSPWGVEEPDEYPPGPVRPGHTWEVAYTQNGEKLAFVCKLLSSKTTTRADIDCSLSGKVVDPAGGQSAGVASRTSGKLHEVRSLTRRQTESVTADVSWSVTESSGSFFCEEHSELWLRPRVSR